MATGNKYHRIKFYPRTVTRDEYGASVDTYDCYSGSTRGEIKYSGGNKTLLNDEIFYTKSMDLTIRYQSYSGITDTMRVQIDDTDERYEVMYIEELGRHSELRLSLTKINL